jgi:ribosomal protein S12 methylthiotransferase accessory factor
MKAVCEAMQLHLILEQLDSTIRGAPSCAMPPRSTATCIRGVPTVRTARRMPLTSSDATDLMCQLQLSLDPAVQPSLLARIRSGPSSELEAVAAPGPTTRAAILERLAADGLTAVSVDVTTSDVRSLGWHVARVVVPGLLSNMPPAFPALGGVRLQALLSRPGAPADPFLHPIPYA